MSHYVDDKREDAHLPLPQSVVEVLTRVGPLLADAAVDLQRSTGRALSEMVGLISVDADTGEVTAGAMFLDADLRAQIIQVTPPALQSRVAAFLERAPSAPTYLRVVSASVDGIACAGVDTLLFPAPGKG